MSAYSWGCNSFQQLATAKATSDESFDQDDTLVLPTPAELLPSQKVFTKILCGWNHTLFLTNDGLVYASGLNENGQLGFTENLSNPTYQSKPECVCNLQMIKSGSCGEAHSVVVKDGSVYSFGSNEMGQLGYSTSDLICNQEPRIVHGLPLISQVSCGKSHTLALSTAGFVYCWGSNEFGQIGTHSKFPKIATPQAVHMLTGCPIIQVCAGGYHCMALTISGMVYAWGRNRFGQLGLGDTQDRFSPFMLELLSNKQVRYMCCGEEFSLALTANGRMYTFGCGSSGQLGHNVYDHQYTPKMVVDLMGTVVNQVTCGRKHTLAYVMKGNKLYSFGLGVKGQLGNDSTEKSNSPSLVKGNWSHVNSHKPDILDMSQCYFEDDFTSYVHDFKLTVDESELNGRQSTISEIFAGGLQSFAIVRVIRTEHPPVCHYLLKSDNLSLLNHSIVEKFLTALRSEDGSLKNRALEDLSIIFSSQSCLSASFLKTDAFEECPSIQHGLKLLSMRSALASLCVIPKALDVITRSVQDVLLPLTACSKDPDVLRVFLVIPELPFFSDPTRIWKTVIPYGNSVMSLPDEMQSVLLRWWCSHPASFFQRLIDLFKGCVLRLLVQNLPQKPNQEIFTLHAAMKTCMMVLAILHNINETNKIVTFSKFYISDIRNKIDINDDYLNFVQNPNVFTFCRYPFIFDITVKASLLQFDAKIQMNLAVNETHRRNIATIFEGGSRIHSNPLLILNVRRSHLLRDTLNEMLFVNVDNPLDLKKPLKVIFRDEEAEDAGGVKKEYFLLLMKEIVDPKYGMFDFYQKSQVFWFKRKSFEDSSMFKTIGMICGLAIYNSIIVEFPFPLCLYKKLLGRSVTLDDFREIEEDVARNLQCLLDYDEDDFTEVFNLNFQVIEEVFGEQVKIDLVPHGDSISLTKDNRVLYVNAYVDYMLNGSVAKMFEAFAEGFHAVCESHVMKFLNPEELMEMVVGCQDYNCDELELIAEYKGEYFRKHPVIQNFWEAFHRFTLKRKKKFLAFLTGSDRVSIFGIKHMKFIIQPVAGGEKGDHLPVAHTCFNLLDLPKYPTFEMMNNKLNQAVDNYEGFGLV